MTNGIVKFGLESVVSSVGMGDVTYLSLEIVRDHENGKQRRGGYPGALAMLKRSG